VKTAAGWLVAGLAVALTWLSLAGAEPARGARVFERCYACHSVAPGEDKLPGPNLRGVVGRRAGTLPGFAFSPAMTEAGTHGLRWTRSTLDAFLVDPQRVFPGNEMGMPGLPSADDRRDLIDYLEQASHAVGAPSRPGTVVNREEHRHREP
jgi:cytochrome c2